jgi:hypothetical protein
MILIIVSSILWLGYVVLTTSTVYRLSKSVSESRQELIFALKILARITKRYPYIFEECTTLKERLKLCGRGKHK